MNEQKIRKAVALAYESNSAAPRITGQGEGFIAEAILAKAKEFGIPTRTEPELVEFLMQLKEQGVNPKVVYDIGACVLHWTNEAERIWPDTKYIAFEAMDASEFLFKEKGMNYSIGVLSDRDGKEVEFYCNEYHPGGNSYYKENEVVNPDTVNYFGDHNKRKMIEMTLDSVVAFKGFPAPDFIKMDVQGAELDVLKNVANAPVTPCAPPVNPRAQWF